MGKSEPKRSAVLSSMLLAAQQKFGERAYTGRESELYLTGIPLRHLSLQWFFDSNVFPVSKLLRIYGRPKQQKSTLAYEFLRLFGEAGCEVLGYVENESGKYSPSLLKSLVGAYDYMIAHPATVEEAQMALNIWRKEYQRLCPKRDQLACFVLDSLFGTSAEEKHKKLNKENCVDRSFPIEANKWSNFLPTYTAELMGWPLAFILTNHEKTDINDTGGFGGPKKRTPGGDAQHFHSAIDIAAAREQNPHPFQTLSHQGQLKAQPHMRLKIFLRTDKSSIGSDNRRLTVNLIFWNDEQNQQVTFYDWWGADALVYAFMVSGGDGAPVIGDRKALAKVCDVSVSRGLYTSKVLGVEGVTDHQFGWALQQNTEVMKAIAHVCGIKQHPVFDGRMPQAIQEAAKRKKKKSEEVKSPLDDIPGGYMTPADPDKGIIP